MKKLIIIFFLLFIKNTLSQNTLYVEYKVKIANEDIFKENSNLRALFEKAMIDADNIKFGLICKKDKSHYFHIDHIISKSDNNSFKSTSLIFAGYTGEIFIENDSVYSKSNMLSNNTYVKKSNKINWIYTNEKKTIDGYECYKATSEYLVENTKGGYFHHPVTAWYCPKIPFSQGPRGYNGLPGLIIELQVRNVTYGVSLIDLNSTKDFEFNKKKIKIMNEVQYNEALDKINDFKNE